MRWQHIITPSEAGQRLDKMLAGWFPKLSRTRLQTLIRNGEVAIGEVAITTSSHRLVPGQVVFCNLPDPEPCSAQPENLPVEFIYQDEDLVVINKQSGISVHPTPHQMTGTLVNGLLYHIAELPGIGGTMRPGIVHRLDKVTSGLLVVAKTDLAHRALSQAFKDRTVHKTYFALAMGSFREMSGVYDQPIGRDPQVRSRMWVMPDGRAARTEYQVLWTHHGVSLLKLHPVTGRTHQLRVHLAYARHPIVLDQRYGFHLNNWSLPTVKKRLKSIEGICLHAGELTFPHPRTGQPVSFSAPLPEHFQLLLEDINSVQRSKP